jgi:hypothetical protein
MTSLPPPPAELPPRPDQKTPISEPTLPEPTPKEAAEFQKGGASMAELWFELMMPMSVPELVEIGWPRRTDEINGFIDDAARPIVANHVRDAAKRAGASPAIFPPGVSSALTEGFRARMLERFTMLNWRAAEYRDRDRLSPPSAMRAAIDDFANNPTHAAERAGAFKEIVVGLTGVDEPYRVGHLSESEDVVIALPESSR